MAPRTTAPSGEYPGAPSLTDTPDLTADCPVPGSVTTVENPSGYPAGVYTRVEWSLAELAAKDDRTITYRAGIPMRSNVIPADPSTFNSTANLDNNTGPSTRETTTEQGLTNRSEVDGTYTGHDKDGNTDFAVSDTDEVTVTAEDVAAQKSVSPGTFTQGGIAKYTVKLQVSEYADATDIVMTDELPNGLCPIDDQANYEDGDAEFCDPDADFAPTGTAYDTVTDDGAAGFTIVFDAIDIDHDDTATVTYQARMRPDYEGIVEPTSSGDSYTNKVSLTGWTSTLTAQDPPDPVEQREVLDDSSASISSDGPALKKTIGTNATPMDCDATTYDDNDTPTDKADHTFTEGSRVCFKLRVDFSDGNSTRDPVVTDFLPENVVYEPGSWQTYGDNDVAVTVASGDATDQGLTFTIGSTVGGHTYVAKGGVFEVILSGIVKAPGSSDVEVAGNLAKFRWIDRDGNALSQRDQVDLYISPPPPIGVDKTVARTEPLSAFADSQQVVHGETVRYQLVITNEGDPDASTGIDVDGIDVWDTLPDGFDCGDVSAITDGGACTDPGDGGHPTFSGDSDHSAIRWISGTLAPQATAAVTYDVEIPTPTSVNVPYDNTAEVHTCTTQTNRGGLSAEHFPRNNVDRTLGDEDEDAPEASDTASVILPAVGLTKTDTTSVDEPGNGIHAAVPGETVHYTIRATAPAHTTVYNGVLSDPLPDNLSFVSAVAGYSATGADPAADELPAGVTFDGSSLDLSLPPTYTNDSGTDQVFQVDVTATVTPDYLGTDTTTNTATFTSTSTENETPVVPPVSATSDVSMIHRHRP